MPRRRLRPGDPVFLAGDLSRYGAYGSLGMPVVDQHTGETVLLSAAHVIGGLARSWPASVVHTSGDNPPTSLTRIRIGRTIDTIPEDLVHQCEVDGALIEVDEDVVCSRAMSRASISRRVREFTSEDIGAIVYKQGCATGETRGEFVEISTDVPLRVRTSPAFDVVYREVLSFYSTDRGSPFAAPGDSGSIVVDANQAVVGLIVGMEDPDRIDDPLTFAIPIQTVLDHLEISL